MVTASVLQRMHRPEHRHREREWQGGVAETGGAQNGLSKVRRTTPSNVRPAEQVLAPGSARDNRRRRPVPLRH